MSTLTTRRINADRITNYRFSIRFCTVAKEYGWKTVGQARQYLEGKNPGAQVPFGGYNFTRVGRLSKELIQYLNEEQEKLHTSQELLQSQTEFNYENMLFI